MDRKMAENNYDSRELIKKYSSFVNSDEEFIESIKNSDKGIVMSGAAIQLKKDGIDVAFRDVNLTEDDGKVTASIIGDYQEEKLLESMNSITDEYNINLDGNNLEITR